MKGNEAKEILQAVKFLLPIEAYTDRAEEALDMAIEALSIEVVRCKDCKHYTERQYMGKSLFVCNVFEWHSQPNDYCSFGERKKEWTEQ